MDKTMEIDEVLEIVDKHIALNEFELLKTQLNGETEHDKKWNKIASHAGAVTGLKLLRRELNGEVEY